MQDLKLYNKSGYKLVYNEGNVNKNDGIVVYIWDYIQHEFCIRMISNIRAIELDLKIGNITVKITSIYRSPTESPDEFNIGLEKYLRSSHSCSYHVITGDVNIDLLSDYEYSEHYKNVFTTYGFISYINSITRPASGTCLDHFLVRARCEDSALHHQFRHY